MPEPDGKLTVEDYEQIKAWFATRWTKAVTCPVCQSTDWMYGSHIVKMVRHADDSYAPGTTVFPYVPVHCKNCSHLMLFGAVIMGLLEAEPEPEPVRRPNPPLPIADLLARGPAKKSGGGNV